MGQSASKEKFRESVQALIHVDVSADDAEFWDELWKIPASAEEVFELLSSHHVRTLRDDHFDNMATLFTQAVAQLCQIVETPYNIYFDQALNCVRVLTRILPFLLEKGDLCSDPNDNVEQLCWGTDSITSNTNPNTTNNKSHHHNNLRDTNTIASSTTGGGYSTYNNGNQQQQQNTSNNNNSNKYQQQYAASNKAPVTIQQDPTVNSTINGDEQEPLALLVIHAAMHMLFLPQFTCDFYEESSSTSNNNNKQQQQQPSKLNNTETTTTTTNNDIKSRSNNNNKDDIEMKLDAGIQERHVEWGIPIDVSPACIVWAPGVGVTIYDILGIPDPNYNKSSSSNSNTNSTTTTTSTNSSSHHHHVTSSSSTYTTRKYDKNRIEVLRLLLTACCDPLYSPADEYNPLASRWLAVATAADVPNSICLFYSLLNTILGYDPKTIPVATGFSEGNHMKLIELAVQVLCVLLDCGIPGQPDIIYDQNYIPCIEYDVASQNGFNIFRTLLARICTTRELTFIYNGFTRLLRNVYEAESTYMGGTKLGCYQELLVLFWKFLEENPYFISHILNQCDINNMIVPICFLMYRSRRDPAHIGLVHICTFVLLKLSGERSLGVSLNRPFTKKLPTDLPLFHGCHTDLLVITLHKLVVNGAYKLVPLYSCFLTIITNISPYWKSMSLVAAVKMVNLFELFSSPKFLYSGQFAYRHLALLLEVFNNILQYQYHGNAHLVYAIVRRKDTFGALASLTLERAQAQCHKVYGEQTTVTKDEDTAPNFLPVTIETKGIPTLNDDESQVSSVAGTPFQPSQEWLDEVKDSLAMETVSRLLQHLVPVVDAIVTKKQGVVDEQQILDALNDITMVGLLPVPHPIIIRKYQPNQYTALWFTAFMWGVIFLRSQTLPLFDGQCVELFQVAVTEEDDD